MEGTISSVEDHGSVVIVWLDVEGTHYPVYMDQRAFIGMVEGEGIRTVGDLIGRFVYFNGQIIEFLDILEAA